MFHFTLVGKPLSGSTGSDFQRAGFNGVSLNPFRLSVTFNRDSKVQPFFVLANFSTKYSKKFSKYFS